MSENVKKLLATSINGRGFDMPYSEICETQIAALNERLRQNLDRIKIVGFRAEEARIREIHQLENIVPLLLPHTAYKSYPESFLAGKKWDRMTKWLSAVSAYPPDNVDLQGVTDIDDWITRLSNAGHFVSCTSGTTGKAAMLPSSQADMDRFCEDNIQAITWALGTKPKQDRLLFGLAPIAQVPRNLVVAEALHKAFSIPGTERFTYPVPPITIGAIARMIELRKAMTDGTAQPSDISEFERTSAERQIAMDMAAGISADALIEAREAKLFISGMWATLFSVAQEVRNRGYSSKDFNPDNVSYVAGGLKGAKLPEDYREFIYETFNLQPENNYQMYSMQEIQTAMPRCQKGGRYHIPPWLVCLPLDQEGENLLPFKDSSSEIEGRAAFFDLSLDGRWGGVISGDRIHIDYGPCECGAHSPSIRDDIARYSDLQGDDKISCSGTVDAYVRGAP